MKTSTDDYSAYFIYKYAAKCYHVLFKDIDT